MAITPLFLSSAIEVRVVGFFRASSQYLVLYLFRRSKRSIRWSCTVRLSSTLANIALVLFIPIMSLAIPISPGDFDSAGRIEAKPDPPLSGGMIWAVLSYLG